MKRILTKKYQRFSQYKAYDLRGKNKEIHRTSRFKTIYIESER